jgi:hypothetical protein
MSGTQGGISGTPEPGPELDCDVPIFAPSLNGRLDARRYAAILPGLEDAGSPRLIAYFWYDIWLDLCRGPLAKKRRESRALWRVGFGDEKTSFNYCWNTPSLFLAGAIE